MYSESNLALRNERPANNCLRHGIDQSVWKEMDVLFVRRPKEQYFWNVPSLRTFVLTRAACRRRWVWNNGETILTGEKPKCPEINLSQSPPQISRGWPGIKPGDSAVRGGRLTAWAKVRPYILCVSNLLSAASHFLKEHCFWDGSQVAPVCLEQKARRGTAASRALRPQLLLCAALSFMQFVLPAWTTSRWRQVWTGEKPPGVEKPVQVSICTPYISHILVWDRTRTSGVRGRQLTA